MLFFFQVLHSSTGHRCTSLSIPTEKPPCTRLTHIRLFVHRPRHHRHHLHLLQGHRRLRPQRRPRSLTTQPRRRRIHGCPRTSPDPQKFNLFLSFDMFSLPCTQPSDADPTTYHDHSTYLSRPLVSTFAREQCTFGSPNLNHGWTNAIKSTGLPTVYFVPLFFVDPNRFRGVQFWVGLGWLDMIEYYIKSFAGETGVYPDIKYSCGEVISRAPDTR
jgi:hypothetical protein